MHSETTAETLARHDQRLTAVESTVDGVTRKLDRLLWLIITTLLGVVGLLVKR